MNVNVKKWAAPEKENFVIRNPLKVYSHCSGPCHFSALSGSPGVSIHTIQGSLWIPDSGGFISIDSTWPIIHQL